MNLAATISLHAYGTSEGVRKEWDTRGRKEKNLVDTKEYPEKDMNKVKGDVLERSKDGAAWIASVMPFSTEVRFYRFKSPSAVPDYFMDLGIKSGFGEKAQIAYNGKWVSFSKSAVIREQKRAYGADR